jgi:hypothetical protein
MRRERESNECCYCKNPTIMMYPSLQYIGNRGALHQETMRTHEDEQIRKVSHMGKGEGIGESAWGMSMSESHMSMRRVE